jgi:very-short-patch-repair endonuclease
MELKLEKWIEYCNTNKIRIVNHESVLYFCAIDIGKILEIKDIKSSLRSFDQNKKKVFLLMTKVGNRNTICLSFIGCIEFIIRSKSSMSEEILKILGYDSIKVISIESKTIGFIKRCFRDEEMIQQFCVGSYRIDLYFPKYKIAVECDEKNGHTRDKHLEQDKERQEFIESELGCTFIRYRPEENEMELADAIYKIQQIIKK